MHTLGLLLEIVPNLIGACGRGMDLSCSCPIQFWSLYARKMLVAYRYGQIFGYSRLNRRGKVCGRAIHLNALPVCLIGIIEIGEL